MEWEWRILAIVSPDETELRKGYGNDEEGINVRDYGEAGLARISDQFRHGKYFDHRTSNVSNEVNNAYLPIP